MDQKQETFEKAAEAAVLNDEELDVVSGGGDGTWEGRSIPGSSHLCRNFVCKKCKKKLVPGSIYILETDPSVPVVCSWCARRAKCDGCKYAHYKEGGRDEGWYCTFKG